MQNEQEVFDNVDEEETEQLSEDTQEVKSENLDANGENFDWIKANKLSSSIENVIDEKNFRLPEMGDYYLGAVDDVYLRMIDKAVNKRLGNPKAAAFYAENPPYKELGYDKDKNVYFLKANMNVSSEALELGLTDGGNINMDINEITGDESGEALKALKEKLNGSQYFQLHLMGMKAPRTAKWATEYKVPKKNLQLKEELEQGWLSQHNGYNYVPTGSDTSTFSFAYMAGGWRQIEIVDSETDSKGDELITYRWLMNAGDDGEVWDPSAQNGKGGSVTYTQAQDAAKALQNIINKYGEIYFTVDGCGMDCHSQSHPVSLPGVCDDPSRIGQLEQFNSNERDNSFHDEEEQNAYYHTGEFLNKQEANLRFDGECYVKVKDQFVNIAKLMMTDTSLNLKPDENYEGPNNEVFNSKDYNPKDRAYADAFFDTMAELDDRPDIVKECMGKEWDDLLDWDVTLGDVTFFVPPTSISSSAILKSEREPLLRANGSMVKNGNHTVKVLTMEVYFNEERGINGYDYTCKNPKGEELHYSVNGLRALIAQFKFVPFVPITNNYINKTLGIGAVTVNSISLNNVENYPKLIQASITMTEFDWQVYMPTLVQSCLPYSAEDKDIMAAMNADTEVVAELNDDGSETMAPASAVADNVKLPAKSNGYTNYFALSINWKTMRYYYQRAIRRGNYLKSLKLAADNEKYVQATMGQVTSLQPMDFVDPTISFYLANEDYMNKILKAKMEALNGKGDKTQIHFNKSQLEALKCMSQVWDSIKEASKGTDFIDNLKAPNVNSGNGAVKGTWCASNTGEYTASLVKYDPFHKDGNITDFNGLEYYGVDGSTQKLTEGEDNGLNYHDVSGNLDTALNHLDQTIRDFAQTNTNGALDFNGKTTGGTVEHPDDNTRRYVFWIEYDIDPDLMTSTETEAFKTNMSNYDGAAPDQVMRDGKIRIPVYCDMQYDDDKGVWRAKDDMPFQLYTDSPDMMLLANAGQVYEQFKDKSDAKTESVPDETKLNNLKFDKYDCGTVRIMNYNMLFSNRISEVHTQGVDGSAPQYLGGEDVTFSIIVKTTDRNTASKLLAIPKKISGMIRRYHAVIPCCPVRVDSEITRFAGIHEVTVENVTLETSNNATGVYILRLDMVTVNRTLRNKEVASKTTIDNFQVKRTQTDYQEVKDGYDKDSPYKEVIDENGNSKKVLKDDDEYFENEDEKKEKEEKGGNEHYGSGVYDHAKFANYFKIKDILGQAELYPDLELPTIDEMKDEGWYYTRYKFQDERVYVDPDFYFVYITTLTSQYYREIALKGMKAGMGDIKLQDTTGAAATLKTAFGKGFVVEDKNEGLQEQENLLKNTLNARNAIEQKNRKENLKANGDDQTLSLLNENSEREEWAVCRDINAQFLEKRYLKEYRSYLARQEAKSAGIVDKTYGASDISNRTDNGEDVYGDDTEIILSDGSEVTDEIAQDILNDESGKYSEEDLQKAKSYVANKAAADVGDTGKGGDNRVTEGAWVFANLENAASAAEIIKDYLNREITGIGGGAGQDAASQSAITSVTTQFLQQGELSAVWSGLNIELSDKFIDLVGKITYAAACAATGKKEFSGSDKAEEWRPRTAYLGVRRGGYQDTDGPTEIKDADEVGKQAIRFGVFNIRMYTADEIQNLTGEAVDVNYSTDGDSSDPSDVNRYMYLLDPYYRTANSDKVEEYKKKCATDPKYCTWAYLRIVLFWLKKLIDMHAIPTMTSDVLRKASKAQIDIQQKEKSLNIEEQQNVEDEDTGAIESLDSYRNFFSKRTYSLDAGKLWTAEVLAVSGGDKLLLDRIDNRDYDALNAYVESCASPSSNISADNNGPMKIRKMTLALIPAKVVSEISAIGITPTTPVQQYDIDKSEKKYLAAAEDPNTYIPHSWHDMIVHDARGRMLRAFPTFYMCMIDEGRDIGQWKLHDNFYNTSAISDLTIVKSRKIPADTATIRLSNFYNTYTTENNDFITKGPSFDVSETLTSIMHPDQWATKMEEKRLMKPPEPKLRLRVGARIHIRLGYGSNADMLPIVFNGIIAELSCEDTVEITAQGDGVELMNPIMQDGIVDGEAKNLQTQDEFISGNLGRIANNATPLQIASALFNSHGGFFRRQLYDVFKTSLAPRNPFGIVHFGDPDFTTICRSGECTQNLYEVMDKPYWGGNHNINTDAYADDDKKTHINFNLFKKTPWDCLNICKSISPDFRLAVLPFGFRSTVFMGLPRYYYAYDYYKATSGSVLEKRKPFRQYHMYTSGEDIIGDGITATNRDMKTVAIGMYQESMALSMMKQSKVGPLFADFDIYPEAQRTMVVDTSLLAKGDSTIANWTSAGYFTDRFSKETRSHMKIAWKATASKLRESVQDMYTGDLVILGDPTVKPEDQFWMNDAYASLTGAAQVKEVVHHLSIENGFTTTISPDVITSVEDPHEVETQIALQHMGGFMSSISNVTSYLASGVIAGLSVGAAAKMAGRNAFGVKQVGKSIKTAGKIFNRAAKGAKASAKGLFGLKRLMNLAKYARLMGGVVAGGLASDGLGLVAAAASVIAAPYLNSVFANELKNLKVVKIFPLKRHGIPYTAGFEGSKGCVFGSPSWDDKGIIGDVLGELTDNSVGSLILDMLGSDELQAYVNKLKRDNKITDSAGNPTETNSNYATMVSVLSNDVNKTKNAVAQQQAQKLATYDNPQDVLDAYNQFKIMDTENYMNDAKLANNQLISDDSRIKPYIEEEFFSVLHEVPSLNEGKQVEDTTLTIGGESKRVKAIHDTDNDGNKVIDLPMLHANAINVLYELIRRSKNKMPGANATDKLENYESTKTTFIVLKSALRVGDKKTQAAAGFTFILQPTDENAIKALSAAIKELTADVNDDAKLFPNVELNKSIFHYKEDAGSHEVAFVVPMPAQKTSDNNLNADTSKTNAEPDIDSD